MTEKNGWTRRMVLASKAALTGAIAMPLPAFSKTEAIGTEVQKTKAVAPARWATATAEELQPFVGQRFRVKTQDHGSLVLKLCHVESPASDPHRPSHLARRVGVTATFEGADAEVLAASEDCIHRISHPRIGEIDAFIKTMPRQAGGYHLEVVLN